MEHLWVQGTVLLLDYDLEMEWELLRVVDLENQKVPMTVPWKVNLMEAVLVP